MTKTVSKKYFCKRSNKFEEGGLRRSELPGLARSPLALRKCGVAPLPTPDSRLPTPDSRLPTPDSLNNKVLRPIDKYY
ncbi:MAG: hypothetical protein F6J90_35605 [Moorea sp. SIOASIH]|uniref:hypothetical protein n=1 Tax=Moorena sp. SIOASIH TaxID=2607817 RepID=UPI0013B5E4A1|nr:hypothetical protein [Moorena sp. SIOASIH]NEO41367.1 hypothetical protein [Moorena sp. SIOASIH]